MALNIKKEHSSIVELRPIMEITIMETRMQISLFFQLTPSAHETGGQQLSKLNSFSHKEK